MRSVAALQWPSFALKTLSGPAASGQISHSAQQSSVRAAKRAERPRTLWDGTGELALRCRLERVDGIVVRFVVGHSADAELERGMAAEEAAHRDFMRLPFQASSPAAGLRVCQNRSEHSCAALRPAAGN